MENSVSSSTTGPSSFATVDDMEFLFWISRSIHNDSKVEEMIASFHRALSHRADVLLDRDNKRQNRASYENGIREHANLDIRASLLANKGFYDDEYRKKLEDHITKFQVNKCKYQMLQSMMTAAKKKLLEAFWMDFDANRKTSETSDPSD